MAFASGSQVQVAYVPESTVGVTPGSPVAKLLRVTDCTLGLEKSMIESAELRADRMIQDVRMGMRRVQGDISTEFSPYTFDDLLEATMGGAWVPTRSLTGVNLQITASTKLITRASGSFTADGWLTNDWIILAGFTSAGNNGLFQLTAVGTTTATIGNAVGLVDEASAAGRTMTAWAGVLKSGVTQRSFSIEVGYKNITQFRLFKGCFFDKVQVSVKPNAIMTAKYSILGLDEAVSTSPMDATPDVVSTTSPLDGNNPLAVIKENGVAIAVITGMDFTLDNQGKILDLVGSSKGAGVNWGRSKITGNLQAYVPDMALYNKYVNETETNLDLIAAITGMSYDFKFPRVKLTGGKIDVSNDDVLVQNIPFYAIYDSVTGTNLQVTKS